MGQITVPRQVPSALVGMFTQADSKSIVASVEEVVRLEVPAEKLGRWVRSIACQKPDDALGVIARTIFEQLRPECKAEMAERFFTCTTGAFMGWSDRQRGSNFKAVMRNQHKNDLVLGTIVIDMLTRCIMARRQPVRKLSS